MPDRETGKTIALMFILSVMITLLLAPVTGTAGVFPSEPIQQEGGFLLETDYISRGLNFTATEAQINTSTRENLTMVNFGLNDVIVEDGGNVPGFGSTRVTKNFRTPDGDEFMMEITAERMEIDGPNDEVLDMQLWVSEFQGEEVWAAGTLGLSCWTATPSQESVFGVAPGQLGLNITNAQFKTHKIRGQDVSMEDFELNMLETTRYTVQTDTNESGPVGCRLL